jgi:protoporphyrinogen oxidase
MDSSEHIFKLAKQLDYNSVAIIGMALRKRAPKMHWVYVPDKSIIFHRYGWISNYSPNNTPDNTKYSAIIAEITIPPWQKINKDRLIYETIEGLKKLEVINESEILFVNVWIYKYGYPVHTIRSNNARNKILNHIKEMGIITLGRWGTWRYLNIDKIFEESKKIIV